ncbi:MAG: RNA polymerase sigma factor [Planctomycetota bacterium]|jgi:RNA polymerase sigma factor (sigma-70 family)
MDCSATGHPSPIWADQTDADLMVAMAFAADDPPAAQAAWEEFYRRHVDYLYAVCLRAYGPLLGGPAGVADLVADTFRRAYQRAEGFHDGGVTDPDRLRLRTRAWLGRIAQRLAQTTLRGRSRRKETLIDLDHWQQVAKPADVADVDPERIAAVRAAVDSLNEREQIVIRTTFQWYLPDQPHQRLPNDVAAELARTLQTTPENLRQIRRRAMRKIRTFLDQHGQTGETL